MIAEVGGVIRIFRRISMVIIILLCDLELPLSSNSNSHVPTKSLAVLKSNFASIVLFSSMVTWIGFIVSFMLSFQKKNEWSAAGIAFRFTLAPRVSSFPLSEDAISCSTVPFPSTLKLRLYFTELKTASKFMFDPADVTRGFVS